MEQSDLCAKGCFTGKKSSMDNFMETDFIRGSMFSAVSGNLVQSKVERKAQQLHIVLSKLLQVETFG